MSARPDRAPASLLDHLRQLLRADPRPGRLAEAVRPLVRRALRATDPTRPLDRWVAAEAVRRGAPPHADRLAAELADRLAAWLWPTADPLRDTLPDGRR